MSRLRSTPAPPCQREPAAALCEHAHCRALRNSCRVCAPPCVEPQRWLFFWTHFVGRLYATPRPLTLLLLSAVFIAAGSTAIVFSDTRNTSAEQDADGSCNRAAVWLISAGISANAVGLLLVISATLRTLRVGLESLSDLRQEDDTGRTFQPLCEYTTGGVDAILGLLLVALNVAVVCMVLLAAQHFVALNSCATLRGVVLGFCVIDAMFALLLCAAAVKAVLGFCVFDTAHNAAREATEVAHDQQRQQQLLRTSARWGTADDHTMYNSFEDSEQPRGHSFGGSGTYVRVSA